MGQTTPIFDLCFQFDLNYIPAKFHGCILQGCDTITVTKSFYRQTCTWKSTQITSVIVPAIVDISRTTPCHDHTHKLTRWKQLPAALSPLVIISNYSIIVLNHFWSKNLKQLYCDPSLSNEMIFPLFFVICHCKVNIFGYLEFRSDKTSHLKTSQSTLKSLGIF